MKKIVVALALVVAASLVGWYFASPGYAMLQLRDAALAGDAEELEQRVDFPSVREGLKHDLKARLALEIADENGGGAERLGSAMAMAFIDPMVDGFVTPEAMAKLVERGEIGSAAGGGDGPPAKGEQAPEWVIERDGLSRFTARPQDRETLSVAPDAPGLVFEREGLGWRLVELEIPER